MLCVAGGFTIAQAGGSNMPNWTKLYTRKPKVVGVWPGDSLDFRALKEGVVTLWLCSRSLRDES